MAETQQQNAVAAPSTWHMYRAMVGIGILCGLLIVTVFQVTKPVIARNKAEALQQAIFQVLPDARSSATFALIDDERFEVLEGEATAPQKLYAGYDEQGSLIGFAIEAEGMGYQDVIRILYGYDFAREAVIGFRVLETKETPGLGDKIEKDETFLDNFKQLDVSLNADASELANLIEKVKPGEKEHPWQIDTITGATISSTAIANMLSRNTSYWIPKIHGRMGDFRQPAPAVADDSAADGEQP